MSDTPWNAALNLLARREHSQTELRQKLTKRFPDDSDSIETVLQRLIDAGLQSDERFAEALFRSQVSRSRGPIRILHEARQKGIQGEMEHQIGACDIDWFELARQAAERKLSSDDLRDPKVKARLARFLAYRGFDSEQVWQVLGHLQNKDD